MKYCICRTNVVMNYTETEAKVREATNDDAWGPTGTIWYFRQQFHHVLFTWNTCTLIIRNALLFKGQWCKNWLRPHSRTSNFQRWCPCSGKGCCKRINEIGDERTRYAIVFLAIIASHSMRNNKLYYTEDIESSIVIVL